VEPRVRARVVADYSMFNYSMWATVRCRVILWGLGQARVRAWQFCSLFVYLSAGYIIG